MIEAFIFDMDGTIVDTEIYWAEAISDYLKDNGCHCSQNRMLDLVFGHSWLDIHSNITTTFPEVADVTSEDMAVSLSSYHQRICDEKDDIVIESSVKLLKKLAEKYPVIVVSGSPRNDIIHNLKLADVYNNVQFILGAEDYPAGKPDPSGFLKGAEILNKAPAKCLVFEDSNAGVTAAKAAGMHCVALSRDNAYRQDVSHADMILSDLSEFDVFSFENRCGFVSGQS
ncbi:MAG: HAD family phosphatase [Kiritimatiellia bacterium]